MSSIARLVARNLGPAPSLRPRPVSLFEPGPPAVEPRSFFRLTAYGDLPTGDEIEQEEFNERDDRELAVRLRPRQQGRSGRSRPTVESEVFEAQESALHGGSSSEGVGETPRLHRVPRKSRQILGTVMNASPAEAPLDETNREESTNVPLVAPASSMGGDLIAEQDGAPALSPALQGSPRSTAPVLRGRPVSGIVQLHSERTPSPIPAKDQRKFDPMVRLPRTADQRDVNPLATEAEPAASIHVTIGRIEIRAETSAAPPRKAERGASPVMGLDEYLRRQNKRGNE